MRAAAATTSLGGHRRRPLKSQRGEGGSGIDPEVTGGGSFLQGEGTSGGTPKAKFNVACVEARLKYIYEQGAKGSRSPLGRLSDRTFDVCACA